MRTHQGSENEEPDLPVPETPGVRALGAMAAASRRAREFGEGPDDAEPASLGADTLRTPARPRPSPRAATADAGLKAAVWIVATVLLAASVALAVSLAAGTSTPTPSASTHTSRPAGSPVAHGHGAHAGLDPSSGTPGQGIQVSGANFLSASGQIVATFNGQVAPTECPAPNSCRVTVPPPNGAATAQVTITTASGTSNAVTFTYG
jgi:hypothetical protein